MIGCTSSSDNEQARPHSNVEYLADVSEIPVKPLPECVDTYLHIHCHCAFTTGLKAIIDNFSVPSRRRRPNNDSHSAGERAMLSTVQTRTPRPQQHISGERVASNPCDFTSRSNSMRRMTMIPVSQALDGRRTPSGVLRPTFTYLFVVERYPFVYPTDHVLKRTRDQEGCDVSLQTHCLCLHKRVQRSARDMSSTTQSTSAARNTNSVTVSAVTIKPVGCLWRKSTMTFFVPVVSPILVASLPGIAVRRYLCSKDFWLTSTPKPLLQGSQNLLSKSLQWRSLAFPQLTRAWNTRTLTSRELGTKETENGGACTATSRSTQSGLRVERKFPG